MEKIFTLCRCHLLICLCLCFIVGCLLAWYLPQFPEHFSFFFLIIIAFFSALLWCLPGKWAVLLCLPFFVLVGFLHCKQALKSPDNPLAINQLITGKERVTLSGRVVDFIEFDGEISHFTLSVDGVLHHVDQGKGSEFTPASGKVAVLVQGEVDPEVRPGALILALADIEQIRNRQNPGAVNWEIMYAAKGIWCRAWVQSGRALVRVVNEKQSVITRIRFMPEHVRQSLAQYLDKHLTKELSGLYQALLIGSRAGVAPQLLEQFKVSGCMHLLAISGLHLSLAGFFCYTLMYWLLTRFSWVMLHVHAQTLALLATAPFLLMYAFIAGMNTPALRALLFSLLVLFSLCLQKKRQFVSLVAGAALLMLAFNPLLLFTASFQLSFSAVLAIVIFLEKRPAWLMVSRQEGKFQRLCKGAVLLFLVSLAATIGTLPWMLLNFNRISLIGPLMNVLVEPLFCLWALPCGLLGLVFFGIMPGLAHAFFVLGGFALSGSIWLVELAAYLPHASVFTITPRWYEIGLFYLCLWVLWYGKKSRGRMLMAVCAGLACLFSFFLPLQDLGLSQELSLTVLDVGHGAASFVQLPTGGNILVDAGGFASRGSDVGSRIIAPFLWHQRIWRLDTVVISHPDSDHYNGMPFLVEHFSPKLVVVNTDPGKEDGYKVLLRQIAQKGIPIVRVQGNKTLLQKENLRFSSLGMTDKELAEKSWADNDRSLAVYLQFGKRAFLLPGDIEGAREKLLLQAWERGSVSLKADCLLAAHHGSLSSSSLEFVQKVDPSVVVVSAGGSEGEHFPAPQHRENWARQGRHLYVTAEKGALRLTTDGQRLCMHTVESEPICQDEPPVKMQVGNQGRK